jgi:hypothetical protein
MKFGRVEIRAEERDGVVVVQAWRDGVVLREMRVDVEPVVDERPIVCVDLNGVLDSYSGWKDGKHFDPPRDGAGAFLDALRARGYRVVVHTTRWRDDVDSWLRDYGLRDKVDDITNEKVPAHVFIDDRALTFQGDFARTLAELDSFAAHWEYHAARDDSASASAGVSDAP